VVFEGTVEGLRASGTLTGRHLDDRASLKPSVRTPSGVLEVRGAGTNNLQDVDVDIPLGVLVAVTGVAGSGKSSLIHGSVSGRDGVVSIDQGAIRGSRRSNPATYTGLLDLIRKAFAKANGVKPALFSANSEGACPNCNGAGVIYTDLAMMAGVATTCEECEGKRFQASVLDHHLGGRDISEVLAMSVTAAEEFFGAGDARTPAAHKILQRMADVGLGYLSLGQPLTTLSGGERQRLKLATHMGEKGGVYVLDEPTTGLHLADVEQLLGLLDRLVDSGKSVIVINHHQAAMAHADWIIDLGPGAGNDGGRIVFEARPPTSWPPVPPSPASTSRPTSALDRGPRGHRERSSLTERSPAERGDRGSGSERGFRTMSPPIESVEVRCPRCSKVCETWRRRSMNLDLDVFTDDYVEEMSSGRCPACGHLLPVATLLTSSLL
jgi:excinuclease ABC A subunit